MVNILGANSVSGGYEIDNSLRFNDGDSAELTRTPSGEGNKQIHTISMWIKRCTIGTNQALFSAGPNDSNVYSIRFLDDSLYISQSSGFVKDTSRLFRDPSAFFHIVIAIDTTNGTQNDRIKVYINGVLETSFAENTFAGGQNFNTNVHDDVIHAVGYDTLNDSVPFDGYISEFHLIDGTQKAASDFGEFNDNGVWIPKEYDGTYGTNGVYLEFKQTGTGTDASGMGADTSGNTHHYAPVNLAATDVTTDTPTNNFATWNVLMNNNPAITTDSTFIEGNTEAQFNSSSENGNIVGTIGALNTGKFYWENKVIAVGGDFGVGIANEEINYNSFSSWNTQQSVLYLSNGNKRQGGTNSSYGASYTTGDIIGVALDLDANTITFYKNGSTQGSISTTSGYNYNIVAYGYNSAKCSVNFGNPSFSISSGNSDGNGYGNFEYAPPSGYLALCTQNLATALSPTIDDGSQYFNSLIYTGNSANPASGGQAITGVGFAPDFTWIKNRDDLNGHMLYDTVRGAGADKSLTTNNTAGEPTNGENHFLSFGSDGFTVAHDDSGSTNNNGESYISWNWKASGSTASNTNGSTTSTVSANTTAGFSIVTYTGTGSNATIGHGLGKVPTMMLIKNRTDAETYWIIYHKYIYDNVGNSKFYVFPLESASLDNATVFNSTAPTSSVFSVGTNGATNTSGSNLVAYCFNDIEGYQKAFNYTGNDSADGTFCYLGFRPAMIILMRSDSGRNSVILDNKRNTYNAVNNYLHPNLSSSETGNFDVDFLSNGIKIRNNNATYNASGGEYFGIAIASNPFVSSQGVPTTAR